MEAPYWRAVQRVRPRPGELGALDYLTLGELTWDAARYLSRSVFVTRLRLLHVRSVSLASVVTLLNGPAWGGLRYLSFRGCDLGYNNVAAIADYAGFDSLRTLDLGWAGVGDGGIAALLRANFERLDCLRLDGNPFTTSRLPDLRLKYGHRLRV